MPATHDLGREKIVQHHEKVRKEFAKQAGRFSEKGLTLSSQEYLAWMVSKLSLHADLRVLDVAAGTGLLSRAIAPYVKELVAIDLTPEMLEEARKETLKGGLKNIVLEEADAAHLPYPNESFDMVVCRFAVHHFEKPELQLNEMARVCKSKHSVGIIDLLSPDNEELVERYNRLERLRDPSHVLALTKKQLVTAMEVSGLPVDCVDMKDIEVDLLRWAGMTKTDPQTTDVIKGELQQEIQGGRETGMRPYVEEGRLKFVQTWAVVIGEKASNRSDAGDGR